MAKKVVWAAVVLVFLSCVANGQVVVHLDVSDVNDSAALVEWGERAKVLIEEWHQRIANTIPTKGFEVPGEVWLRIRRSNRGIGGTAGGRITISSGWIEKHPEDIGLVHHELVHVIQNYGARRVPGWVTEGIADYLRWALFDGKAQDWFPFADKPNGYRDSYRVTGGFFLWLESDKAPGIVNKLNTAARMDTYDDEGWFEEETGETIDALWAEYVKDRKSGRSVSRFRTARYSYDLSGLKPLAKVTAERNAKGFAGLKMGAPASDDYADMNSGKGVVVRYVTDARFARPHISSGAVKTSLPRLIDGKAPLNNDDTDNNVWYDRREGRFVMDLKESVALDAVKTYSWHVANRAPQVFTLWGSNKSELPDVTTGLVKDPNWTFISRVDTSSLGWGGVHGTSVQMAGPVKFRYLMWVTADVMQGTFFSEIDVYVKE